jgi:hypothetical protein
MEFYNGGKNVHGVRLADVWNYSDHQYEAEHYFIQWVFPSDEPSAINMEAPIVDRALSMAFRGDIKMRVKLVRSFIQFLKFLGIGRDYKVVESGKFYLRVLRPNHNHRRITRVLRSLYILGLEDRALDFYAMLCQYRDQISPITFDYWTLAIK